MIVEEQFGAGSGLTTSRPGFSSHYATIDHWHANLAESLIYFGPHAKRVHALDDSREKFGLGEVVRHYDEFDKPEILWLLETISPEQPSFEFRSRLKVGDRFTEVEWIARLDVDQKRVQGVIIITDVVGDRA